MRPTAVLPHILLLTTTCAAWPFDWDTLNAVKRELAPILKRQQSTTYNLSIQPTTTQGSTGTTAAPTATATSESDASSTGDDTSTLPETGTASGTDGSTGTVTAGPTTKAAGTRTSNSTTPSTYDARLPAGGISMITPNPLSTQYYKISDYVTFVWNYTSVSSLPSAVDILAYGALNSATYTLALNESVSGPTQAFTWDTNAFQANATTQLLTETYTLIVHDAAKDVSATPSPGYLGTANQFTFGMYLKQSYEDLGQGWQCATCSGAMSQAERQTLIAVFGMAGITVLTFGWFTGVAGLW